MRFLHSTDLEKELTYEEVFMVPQYSGIASRTSVDIAPYGVPGMQIPVVVANMTAAAGRRMAETVARRGGLVILPQDYALERISEIVAYVKSRHHVYETPVVLDEQESMQTALNLIYKRAHGAVIVVNDRQEPVGIFTERDAEGRDKHTPIAKAMVRELVAVKDGEFAGPREIFDFLTRQRVRLAPVVDAQGKLLGVVTKPGCVRASMYKPALNAKGELLTAVAVGARKVKEVVPQLIAMGVDVIVLDTAHGYQQQMLDAVKEARALMGPAMPLVAGNVVTGEAATALVNAGANIIKVGVGPGAMCSTRMATGVGRPQFSAVLEASAAAKALGAHVWADGGIRHGRDVALALAAGADSAMFGSWFAGTYESPADILFDEQGRPYKSHHGMASTRAVLGRNEGMNEFVLAQRAYFEEGISSSRMYLKKGEESAEDILDTVCAGLRSACTYAGAQNIKDFHDKVVVGTQSPSGYNEGKPVPTSW